MWINFFQYCKMKNTVHKMKKRVQKREVSPCSGLLWAYLEYMPHLHANDWLVAVWDQTAVNPARKHSFICKVCLLVLNFYTWVVCFLFSSLFFCIFLKNLSLSPFLLSYVYIYSLYSALTLILQLTVQEMLPQINDLLKISYHCEDLILF